MTKFDFTRRVLLAGAAELTATAAFAKALTIGKPAPAFYRFKLGTLEVAVISGGPPMLGF